MIFPFVVVFKKRLEINTILNENQILLLLKDKIHEMDIFSQLIDKKIVENIFSFRVDLRKHRNGGCFDGVNKGFFEVIIENGYLLVIYSYTIWSNIIIMGPFIGLPLFTMVFTNYGKFREEIISILFVFIALLKPSRKIGQLRFKVFCKFKLFNYEKKKLHRKQNSFDHQAV